MGTIEIIALILGIWLISAVLSIAIIKATEGSVWVCDIIFSLILGPIGLLGSIIQNWNKPVL